MLVDNMDLAGSAVGVAVAAAGSAFAGTAVVVAAGVLVGANDRVLVGSAGVGLGVEVEVMRD
jgi:hypothetical protein